MSKLQIKIALCAIAERDARMISSVLARFKSKNNTDVELTVIAQEPYGFCHIAVANLEDENHEDGVALVGLQNSGAYIIEVSTDGLKGTGNYKIAHRSLLFQLVPIIDQLEKLLAQQASSTSTAHTSSRTITPIPQAQPTQAPKPSNNTNGLFSDSFQDVNTAKRRPLTALIVDDSDTVRIQLQGALKRIGINAMMAGSGEQALNTLEKNQDIDLVFLDVIMPGEDGYTICKKIRKDQSTKSLRVIMLTSKTSPFDRARGALAGCDTYLTKPIDSKSFFGAVDKSVMKICQNDRAVASARGYLYSA